MKVNETVYFKQDGCWNEAEVFLVGGDNQVLLSYGDSWVLKYQDEVKTAEQMTNEDWKKLSIYK